MLLRRAVGGEGDRRCAAEAAHFSIVVLPFANLSGDPAQDYLADALTDELTTAIARVIDAFVIAHNTAATFKGKPVDAKAIGKELGVRYVMEGSVQPTGNQVRVNAQPVVLETTVEHDLQRAEEGRDQHQPDEIEPGLPRPPALPRGRTTRTPKQTPSLETEVFGQRFRPRTSSNGRQTRKMAAVDRTRPL